MLRFPATSDQQMADLIAYLHSVAAISRTIPANRCP
jgi:cytochrome c1